MSDRAWFTVAILDDDPDCAEVQRRLVARHFPEAHVTVTHEARPIPSQDVYLVDNRFGGNECALDLATQIRRTAPDSLVIVWSGCVTKELLKKLAPVGVDAVAEKGNRDDVEAAMEVMRRFLERARPTRSFVDTIRSIRDLLARWNATPALEAPRAAP